jgi:hypothetical protein
MASDPNRRALSAELQAVLEGLEIAAQSDPSVSAVRVAAVLEAWGDAMRLGVPMSDALRKWVAPVEGRTLGTVVGERSEEVETWALPQPGHAPGSEHLSFTLLRRDQTESLISALSRLVLGRSELPKDIPGFETLSERLAEFDRALSEVVDRLTAGELLGPRVALQGGGGWYAALRLPEVASEDRPPEPGIGEEILPDDELVERYVSQGALRKYIEAAAAGHADFAEDLAATIDAFLEQDLVVSLVAAHWRKRHRAQPAATEPLRAVFQADARAAAATRELEPLPPQRWELGPVPGLSVDAEAVLVFRDAALELRVFGEGLLRVALGGTEGRPSEAGDTWTARVALEPGQTSVPILVEDARGGRFDETLSITLRG